MIPAALHEARAAATGSGACGNAAPVAGGCINRCYAARNGHRLDADRAVAAASAPLPHGDLWRGNAAFLGDGTPVMFDLAVYAGDAETDLAMTERFGSFPPAFGEAYRALRPPDPGYAVRRDLYNLYHVLNHLNLSGGGYLG